MKNQAIALFLFASIASVSCTDVPSAICYENKAGALVSNDAMTSGACFVAASLTGCTTCGVKQITDLKTKINICYNTQAGVNIPLEPFDEQCKKAGGSKGQAWYGRVWA